MRRTMGDGERCSGTRTFAPIGRLALAWRRARASVKVDSREVAQLSQHCRYATVEEAANYLRVERQTIYRMLIKGKIPGAFKVGRAWRIDLDEMLRSLAAKRRE